MSGVIWNEQASGIAATGRNGSEEGVRKGFPNLSRFLTSICFAALFIVPLPLAWNAWHGEADPASPSQQVPSLLQRNGAVRVPTGRFLMGSHDQNHTDQQPVHSVRLNAFWVDVHPVTNEQFARFVQDTGHQTTAERVGSSRVFDLNSGKWQEVRGADWRHPHGPEDSISGKHNFPVVHVSWFDAVAYASWARKRLATEAEYEYAARGGLSNATYPWGSEPIPLGVYQANGWQGWFPDQNRKLDGFGGTSPVDTFPASRWGLHDMAGNVWCWCADWYDHQGYGESYAENPAGPPDGSERVLRGGSWQSSHNHEGDLRLAFRGHARPEQTTNHIGFRCVSDDD